MAHDGPYVFNQNGRKFAYYVNGDENGPASLSKIDVNDTFSVTVDNESATSFEVTLKTSYPRSALEITAPEKYVAISDLEGNFDAMVGLLKSNNVIDDNLSWTYGSGHLVLIGDMVDRGDNVVPLLWLIYKLETEAQQAGGQIHYVLGNHERYLLDGRVKSAAKKYYGTFRTTGKSPRELWSEDTELGLWLRSKPVMIKLGDTLFVHGGVSPRVLREDLSLAEIDADAAQNIVLGNTIKRTTEDSVIHNSDGLLFSRSLAKDMSEYNLGAKASIEHVENVLSKYNVNQIAIGHTLVDHIGYDYDGKVIRVDVPHSDGTSEGLLMDGNAFWVVDNSGNKSPLSALQAPNKTTEN